MSHPVKERADRGHLKEITGARFIAAAVVFLHHTTWIHLFSPTVESFAPHGRAGVCFFFVLSGFILSFTYRHRLSKEGLGNFFGARFARIYPMHLAALCLSVPVSLVTIAYNPAFAFWVHGPALNLFNGAVGWLATAALVQIYLPNVPHWDYLWNSPSWSIACEAFFYLTFPLSFAFILRYLKTRRAVLLAIAACTAVQWIAVEFCAHAMGHFYPKSLDIFMAEVVYKLPFFRIWEFWIGCCLGLLFTDFRPKFLERRRGRDLGLAIGFLFVLLIIYFARIHPQFTFFILWFALYTLPFALIILCLASGRTALSRFLGSPLMVLLGEASYSFYLLHFLFIQALSCQYPKADAPLWTVAATFLACVAASVLCLKGIEVPSRFYIRKWLDLKKRHFVSEEQLVEAKK